MFDRSFHRVGLAGARTIGSLHSAGGQDSKSVGRQSAKCGAPAASAWDFESEEPRVKAPLASSALLLVT